MTAADRSFYVSAWAAGRPLLAAMLAGLLFSALTYAAQPPAGAWPLALLAVAPLACVGLAIGTCLRVRRRWIAACVAGLSTLPLWLAQLWWIGSISSAGLPPLAVYMCLYPIAFVGIVATLRARFGFLAAVAAAPLLWTGLEVFRGSVAFDGFAWYFAGHPLIEAGPILVWPARFGGALLVSLLTAVVGVSIAVAALGRWRIGGMVIGAVALGWIGPGLLFEGSTPGRDAETRSFVRFGLVQTNVPQSIRGEWTSEQRAEDFLRFARLTEEAIRQGADIVVWPETMYPYLTIDPAYPEAADLLAFQEQLGTPMIIGANGFEGLRIVREPGEPLVRFDRRYNSAFLLDEGRVQARYDKVRLTPFGEIMPYFSRIERLEQALLALGARGMTFDLSAGEKAKPLEISAGGATLEAITPICFEATDARVCRRLLARGDPRRPGVMVNLTNDGWFGDSRPGRLHHLLTARWRCVELGRPMARAANTGVSALVDPWGRVIESGIEEAPAADRQSGVLVGPVEPAAGRTAYVAGGWTLRWALLAGLALCVVGCLVPRNPRRTANSGGDAGPGSIEPSAKQTRPGKERGS